MRDQSIQVQLDARQILYLSDFNQQLACYYEKRSTDFKRNFKHLRKTTAFLK